MKTLGERKSILENEITKMIKQGWQIASRAETACHLVRNKKPSGLSVLLLFSISFLPSIGSKGIKKVLVEVNEEGEITYTSKDLSHYMLKRLNIRANKDLKQE